MQKIILFPLMVLSILLTAAYCNMALDCTRGDKNIKEFVRNVKDFNSAEISISGDVVLMQGPEESLKIITDQNIEDLIQTEVKNGKLVVKSESNICPSKLQFLLTVKDLNELGINGSADITSNGALNLKDFKITINGSGDVDLNNLQSDNLMLDIEGSGDIQLQGSGNSMKIDVNGSGDVRTKKFSVHNADITVNGSGDIYVYADGILEASVNGSGDIHYTGKPGKVNTHVTGSGDVVAE